VPKEPGVSHLGSPKTNRCLGSPETIGRRRVKGRAD